MKKLTVLIASFLMLTAVSEAAIRTSVLNGNFSVPISWDCLCIPANGDTLIINHNIFLLSGRTMNEVTVNSGGLLRVNNGNSRINGNLTINTGGIVNNDSRLDVFGNYYLDGKNQGSGLLRLRGVNATIDGVGEVENTVNFRLMNGNKTILSTAVITVSNTLQLNNSVVITNLGTVECNRLNGNANRTWINSTNASLIIRQSISANLVLQANATGNTVSFSRLGTGNVVLKDPVSSTYYNLIIDGDNDASIKRLRNNTIVLNDLTIEASTFDVRRAGTDFDLTIGGDWIRNGGTFRPRNAEVTLNGSGAQSISSIGTENFNELTISGSNVKLLNTNLVIDDDLTINSTLDANSGGDFGLSIAGNFTINGTFEPRNGLVTMEGTSSQIIGGGGTLANLTIDNSSTGVSMSSGNYDLLGTLTLTDGNLATNNALTLVSNSSGTARLAEITAGSLSGDITMERFIATGATGWRFLSSAVADATLTDWDNDMITSGFPGSDFPSFPFTSILRYDETTLGAKENGYINPSNVTDAINVGEGYWVYSGDTITGTNPFVIDVTGAANTGNVSLPVTYTDDLGQPVTEDGWNLVGNPYPSSINWDDPDWTKTNINNAIYIWDTDAQQFATYIGGVGTNGGSAIIPSSQAFWVQANGNSPSLNATEGVKSAVDQTFLRTRPIETLSISVAGNNKYEDQTVLRIENDATDGFDANYDAYKLKSSNPDVPYISLVQDNMELSINTLSQLSSDTRIPLKVTVPTSGTYVMNFENSLKDESLGCLFLEDQLTGKNIDLSSESSYSFVISDTTTNARFIIHLGAMPLADLKDVSCFGDHDGAITAIGQGVGPWNYTLTTNDGTIVKEDVGSNADFTAENLVKGTYHLTVSNSGLCGTTTQQIELNEPAQVTSDFEMADEFQVGETVEFKNTSNEATAYVWSFGDGQTSKELEPTHIYNTPGIYEVSLIASNGQCMDDKTKQLVIQAKVTTAISEVSKLDLNVFGSTNGINIKLNNGQAANVEVRITNISGQLIEEVAYGNVSQLNKVIAMDVVSGIYLVTVQIDGQAETFKVPLLK